MSANFAADFAEQAEHYRLEGNAQKAIDVAEAGLLKAPEDLRGRIALALARIDLGDFLEAREELAGVLAGKTAGAGPDLSSEALASPHAGASPGAHDLDRGVDDDELETAFAEAESNPDEMMDANRLVEQTLRAAELDAPEADFDVANHPTYKTESMAMLLDSQGRGAEAEALRESLAAGRDELFQPAEGEAPLEPVELDAGFEAASFDEPLDDRPPDDLEAPADAPTWHEAGFGPGHARQLQVVATLEGWLYNLKRNQDRNPRRASAGRSAAGGGL